MISSNFPLFQTKNGKRLKRCSRRCRQKNKKSLLIQNVCGLLEKELKMNNELTEAVAKSFNIDGREEQRKEQFKQLVCQIIYEAYLGKAIYSEERTKILLND